MKKIFLLVLIVMICFSVYAGAESSDSNSDANADANAVLNYNPQYNTNSKSYESPTLLNPMRQDGSNIFPSHPVYKDDKEDESLPDLYKIQGWKILRGPPFNQGIPWLRIKNERKSWLSQEVSLTGFPASEKISGEDDFVFSLDYYPVGQGIMEVGHSEVFSKEKTIITQALSEALYHIVDKTKCKYVVILYNSQIVSKGNVKALGSAFVTGVPLGPSDKMNNAVLGLAGGTGIGTAEAYIYRKPLFMVIGFNKISNQPYRSFNASADKSVLMEKPKEDIYPLTNIGDVNFDYNSSDIKEDQKKVIDFAASEVSKYWQKVKENNMVILVLGWTSEEGSEQYNNNLGQERARKTALLFARELKIKGISPEEVIDYIRFASAGEYKPEFNELSKNRKSNFYLAKKI